ncbi:MAG: acetyltransferase [Collimonas pratensis]|uniref:acetyltransferase n=1 Tax=Collimonas pratensis TaxID=279113 RepID=UPI003C793FC1
MITIRRSRATDFPRSFDIWQSAVKATHNFLSEADFQALSIIVREQYFPIAQLWIATDGQDYAMGFMGLTEENIDTLFVHAEGRSRGYGKALMRHAIGLHPNLTIDVNEQNGAAFGFYRHMGFVQVGRSEVDSEGRPYPLLHLRR